jgi:ribonuclease BN (tRNA processing enzyme)
MIDPFQITVLGSGTGVPRPDRAHPGYFVEVGDQKLLVDPGPGSLRQLAHLDVHINELDRMVITHRHPDHTLDLMLFMFASRFEQMERQQDLEIICPVDFSDMVEDMKSLYDGFLEPETYEIHLEEVEDVVLDFPGWTLDIYPTIHMKGSFCCSFLSDEGAKIFYSSDTAYAQTVATAAQDADIAVVECSLPDDMDVDGHMTPDTVEQLASVAEPYLLLLTHLYPPVLEQDPVAQIKEDYDGHVELAEDLKTYSVYAEDE